jgi:hypothetical protein
MSSALPPRLANVDLLPLTALAIDGSAREANNGAIESALTG